TELGALLRERLAEQLPRPSLEALRRASGGNPMFAFELAREAGGGGAGRPAPTLSAALASPLRTLDQPSRTATSFSAAALRPSPDLLLRGGVTRRELRSAIAAAVLEVEGERLAFVHPMLGAVAYEELLPDERREIHGRLATASTDIVERGHHVSRSTV